MPTLTLPNDRQIFQIPLVVKAEDIDELNHVNNVVYVRWAQEVATAHWHSRTTEAMRTACAWVVLRHEIDYRAAASANMEVIAYTWVAEAQGAMSDRFVSVCEAGTKRILCEAKTTWCLLDSSTHKPKRITNEIDVLLKIEK